MNDVRDAGIKVFECLPIDNRVPNAEKISAINIENYAAESECGDHFVWNIICWKSSILLRNAMADAAQNRSRVCQVRYCMHAAMSVEKTYIKTKRSASVPVLPSPLRLVVT